MYSGGGGWCLLCFGAALGAENVGEKTMDDGNDTMDGFLYLNYNSPLQHQPLTAAAAAAATTSSTFPASLCQVV